MTDKKYNYKNRKTIVNSFTHLPIVATIDRVRFSLALSSKKEGRSISDIFTPMYKERQDVKAGKILSYIIYSKYANCDPERGDKYHVVFRKAYNKNISKIYLQQELERIEKEIDKDESLYIDDLEYNYMLAGIARNYEYKLLSKDDNYTVKANNYFKIDINNELQNYNFDKNIYDKFINIIKRYIEREIFINSNKVNVENFARELANCFTFSEIEIAFDFNYEFGSFLKFFLDGYSNSRQEGTTTYLNRKRWNLKMYNKSRKDRIDNHHICIEKNDDVIRLEILLKRPELKSKHLEDLSILKHDQFEVFSLLTPLWFKAVKRLISFIPYKKFKKKLIEFLKVNNLLEVYGKVDRSNYKNIFLDLLKSSWIENHFWEKSLS